MTPLNLGFPKLLQVAQGVKVRALTAEKPLSSKSSEQQQEPMDAKVWNWPNLRWLELQLRAAEGVRARVLI
jgi:hypothetical protein